MKEKKILIVEDEEVSALHLKISLKKHGYKILAITDNLQDAINKIKVYMPNIVIIDISLQDSDDGIKLARIIRQKYHIPFIYLTSHSDEEIIKDASKTEPYGYIIKPFDPSGLHATLQMALYKYDNEKKQEENINILKQQKQNLEKLLYSKKKLSQPLMSFSGDYQLNINTNEVYYHNKKIKLTKKENAFIKLLVAQLGLVVEFEQAVNYIWSQDGATQNSIRTLVWRLRAKLPTDIIKNASGAGYYIE